MPKKAEKVAKQIVFLRPKCLMIGKVNGAGITLPKKKKVEDMTTIDFVTLYSFSHAGVIGGKATQKVPISTFCNIYITKTTNL